MGLVTHGLPYRPDLGARKPDQFKLCKLVSRILERHANFVTVLGWDGALTLVRRGTIRGGLSKR